MIGGLSKVYLEDSRPCGTAAGAAPMLIIRVTAESAGMLGAS